MGAKNERAILRDEWLAQERWQYRSVIMAMEDYAMTT
tara:strand:- start:284 stop:394 length:111 start_codon:yes stop_codon:yes gene_type:complete